MANQEATGACEAFAFGTGARGGSHLADQEASGAGKAFAYGTGAGGRSHLAKLRDGARHCNSAMSLSFLLRILCGAAKAPQCTGLYAALRDGAQHCNR